MERRHGAFVLLDALGFRGVWSREDPQEFAGKWEKVVNRFQVYASDILRTKDGSLPHASRQFFGIPDVEVAIDVSAFSDTIALGVSGPDTVKILYHASLLTMLGFMGALRDGIFLRGAISINTFYRNVDTDQTSALGALVGPLNEVESAPRSREQIRGKILVGPAADDAAEWHSKADWIGVMLTPAAGYALDSIEESDSNREDLKVVRERALCKYDVPLVKREGSRGVATPINTYVLNWPEFFTSGGKSAIRAAMSGRQLDHLQGRRELLDLFARGPIGTDVREKYEHTLRFHGKVSGVDDSVVVKKG